MKFEEGEIRKRYRRLGAETSRVAAELITESGEVKTQQEIILRLVYQYPGLTSRELATKTAKLDRYQIARRLPELAGMGLVEKDYSKRKKTGFGWRIAVRERMDFGLRGGSKLRIRKPE